LGLRVLMKIKIGDREIVAPVLVNSGFESDESEIIVPYSMIERMGLWLPVRYLLETKGILGTRTGFPLGRLIPSAAHRGPHRRAPRLIGAARSSARAPRSMFPAGFIKVGVSMMVESIDNIHPSE